ncbi:MULTISPECIES: ABC transporter permease [unclassified Fusibacter]|uniref:ABC transporter permease n=1 Tax=unclassified Fusibacter TaxID=2624464 RepID=UPI0010102986|nr:MULTISPECIES: ABC transporter permease [unclassified Fusibacter]MCK8061133.1 ABC transporter permease [Fusibacter sp. A2]NPE23331.1 ABC transporter permease [Fusibacter sp. A1]RXV59374.1 ABC transporter permease subunit [Fusibacter sp. A1]
MDYILDGFKEAFLLLIRGDSEIYKIIFLSIMVSGLSTLLATLIGLPLGIYTGIRNFPLKKLYGSVLFTSMGIPPVVIGLIVTIFLSRKGPLGTFELLFTPEAMVIAQFVLVLPIVTGILFGTAREKGKKAYEVAKTLGANRREILFLLIRELQASVLLAIMSGFGRAISEVGAVMLVGGNIKGQTRVMTTFITMNNSMGAYEKSIAMAIVLLTISLIVNGISHHMTGGRSYVD